MAVRWSQSGKEKTCLQWFELARLTRINKALNSLVSICFSTSVDFSPLLPIHHPPPCPPLWCRSNHAFHLSPHACLFSVLTHLQRPRPFSSSVVTPSSSPCARPPLRVCRLIILSPSPSSTMLKFRPLHQFALTVNCVENNSGCWAACPGQGCRQIGRDGMAVSL